MKSPRRSVAALALALAALALAGCFQRKQTGVINPDGSGKITLDTVMEPPPTQGPGAPKPDMLVMGKQIASGMISQVQGVDAWKDITIEATNDGKAHVLATAYFPDINKLKLDAGMPLSWKKNADGTFTLALQQATPPNAASAPATPLTDDQVKAQILQKRTEYKQQLPMAQMILNTLRLETTYILPGNVTGSNIFTKTGDNSVTLAVEGKQILAAMDKVMNDDEKMAAAIKSGKDVGDDQDLMVETIFNKKGPVSATVAGGGKPLFDYKSEMEAARAAQADTYKKAGIDPSKPMLPPGAMPPPEGQPPEGPTPMPPPGGPQ